MTNIRSRNRVRIAMVAVLLTMALALSACVEVAVESEFESDGSATHSVSSMVEKAMLDDDMLGGELNLDEMEQQARDAGLNAERIETDTHVGIRISVDVEDNEDLGSALNDLLTSMEPDAPEVTAFSGGFTRSSETLGGDAYSFELTVDGSEIMDQGGEELDESLGEGAEMDINMEMVRQFFNLTYAVTMPGQITEHNGTELSSNTVQWDLPFEGSETFTAESEEGSGFPILLITGAGAGVLAILLMIGGGVLLLRQRPSLTEPAAARTTPAPDAHQSHRTTTEPGTDQQGS